MIRIDMICQDTRHPDKRKRHPGRSSCEVAGRRFETLGPAPIYRIVTLLWLHSGCHGDWTAQRRAHAAAALAIHGLRPRTGKS